MNTVCVLACSRSRISTSMWALLRAMTGLPYWLAVQSRPSNLSAALEAKRLTTSSWSVARLLIAHWVARNSDSYVEDVRCTHTITVGGSREMLENAFTAS